MLATIFPELSFIITSLTVQNIIEIGMVIVSAYILLTWLAQDTTPLLEWFCGIYAFMCTMRFFNFSTISIMLWHLMPFIGIMLAIFHQHTLQKHYITWRTKTTPNEEIPDWYTLMMKLTLRASDKNISLIWIIEQHDALDSYFMGGNLRASLTPHLIELIISAPSSTPHYIWMTTTGIVRAHNPHIIVAQEQLSYSSDIAALALPLQKLHALSTQHDCIIVQSIAHDRSNIVLHRGNTYEKLTTNNCLNLLRQLTQSTHAKERMPCSPYDHSAGRQQRASPGQSL